MRYIRLFTIKNLLFSNLLFGNRFSTISSLTLQYGRRVAAMKLWDPEKATPEHLFCVAFLTTIVVAKEPKTQGPHLNEKIWFEKLVEKPL